ncbi:hypothetical protein [Micromonospora sp. NPDC005203]|uniref:hypothetical protein n=1 Tax=Micromonospora sp. NPDC005203 TaxID=3364226 RepID=UPI003693CBB0
MSPESRRRKRAKPSRSGQQVVRRTRAVDLDQCDCPACSDPDFDPQNFIDDLVTEAADLIKTNDPIEAELFAATILSAGDLAGEGFAEALNDGMLPAVADIGTPDWPSTNGRCWAARVGYRRRPLRRGSGRCTPNTTIGDARCRLRRHASRRSRTSPSF